MTFRINRLHCLKTKAFGLYCIEWLLFIAVVFVLSFYSAGGIEIATVMAILCFTVIYFLKYLLRFPNKFTIADGEVILWMRGKRSLPDGVSINRRTWRWAKLFVTMRNVEKIEYKADMEEKVGTIRLYGEIRTQTKSGEYIDPYEPLEMVELVGVRSFREARYQLQKAFPEAIHTRI